MTVPEATEAQRAFAADVLQALLQRIATENARGSLPFRVLFAWTDGPLLYLVFQAPPSEVMVGLVLDTREALYYSGPWRSLRDAVFYYYDGTLYEYRPGPSTPHPGDPNTILWRSDIRDLRLPGRPSDIPDRYRQVTPVIEPPLSPSTHRWPEGQPHSRRYLSLTTQADGYNVTGQDALRLVEQNQDKPEPPPPSPEVP